MREKKYCIYLTDQERKMLMHSLIDFKNRLIQQGRYTDCVDEAILKAASAPVRRVKIV